jgi:hypothetical protein
MVVGVLQVGAVAVGSVEITASPVPSTTTQNPLEAHDTSSGRPWVGSMLAGELQLSGPVVTAPALAGIRSNAMATTAAHATAGNHKGAEAPELSLLILTIAAPSSCQIPQDATRPVFQSSYRRHKPELVDGVAGVSTSI